MTLDEAVAEIEGKFRCVQGLRCAFSPTYEEYTTICSGGRKIEGKPTQLYRSENEAVDKWLATFKAHYWLRSGTLYWRAGPEMHESPDKRRKAKWTVFSRVLITEKPVLAWEDWFKNHPPADIWVSKENWDRGVFA